MSDFERAVLGATRRIPSGGTRPYDWLARDAGRPPAVRAVGTVPARKPSPLLAPCHRVVGADGGTGAHMFGPARREELLRGEDANLDEVATYARRRMRYLGGGPTGVVCLPTCHDARRITPAHRRGFRTPGAALAPGHRPCRTCRPVLGTAA